jgi:hypothetical protein
MPTRPKHRDHIVRSLAKAHERVVWVRKILGELTVIVAMLAVPLALYSGQAEIARLIINLIKLLRI